MRRAVSILYRSWCYYSCLPLILVVKMVQVMLTHEQAVEVLTSVRMKHHQDVQDDNSLLLFDNDNMFAHLELINV